MEFRGRASPLPDENAGASKAICIDSRFCSPSIQIMRDFTHRLSSKKTLAITAALLCQWHVPAADVETEPKPEVPVKPATETAVPASADKNFDAVANSVVKIFSTIRYPDVYKPWTKSSPTSITGSGAIIEGKRIL